MFTRLRASVEKKLSLDGKRNPLLGLLQVGGVITAVLAVVIYAREPEALAVQQDALRSAGAERPAPVVAVIAPRPETVRLAVRATGTVAVRNYVALTMQVTGKVERVAHAMRNGGSFKAGEVLIEVESTDFEQRLAQAKADVDSAKAQLKLQIAQGDAAEANYAILHPGKKVPPLVARTPQIDQTRALLASATASLRIAETNLKRTQFSLPFDGSIAESRIEAGQVVSQGQSFGRAFSHDAVEASVPITLAQLEKLQPLTGRNVTITAGETMLTASVDRVSAELDEKSRFAKVFIPISALTTIRPGTFVSVEVEGPEVSNVFRLAANSEQVGGSFWTIRDGELRATSSRIIDRTNDGVVVRAFDYGEGIVAGVVPGAVSGMAVRVAGNGEQKPSTDLAAYRELTDASAESGAE